MTTRSTGAYAGRMRARAGSAALAMVLLAGCQSSGGNPQPSPTAGGSSEPANSTSPSVSVTPATPNPSARYSMPLALVVHATRPTVDVAVSDARKVVASGATRWSAIGQPGGQMRVLSTKERRASDVLREVRASRNVLGIVPADAVDARVRVLTVGGRHPLRDPKRYPLQTSFLPTGSRGHHPRCRRRHHARPSGRRPSQY